MSKPIRILIAEDHPVVREGFAALFERYADIEVVGKAANGKEAVALFRQLRPDVTLMDLRMPQMDGFEAISHIRKEFSHARILVLTTYDGDEDVYRCISLGVKGYLLKGMPCEQLIEAIRCVSHGQTYVPADLTAKLAERMTRSVLSAREAEVLKLLAAGKSNQEIGSAMHVAESTVKSHVNAILSKLNVCDRTQAVTTAIKRGLIHL